MRIPATSIPAILVLALVSGCSSSDSTFINTVTEVLGSGNIVEEQRAVSGFVSVTHVTEGRLNIVQGGMESLTIRADDNILPYLVTEVQGTTLVLRTAPNTDIEPTQTIEFDLTLTDLATLQFAGIGEVIVTNLAVDDLDVDLTGVGPVTVSGMVTTQNVALEGLGNYHGGQLQSTDATVVISGVGDATVRVTGTLDATISGIGSVYYYGPPATIIENVTGTGSVQPGP